MKLLSVLALSVLGPLAFAQADHCEAQLIDQYNRVIQVYRTASCKDNMKECRIQQRQSVGLDCRRIDVQFPAPLPPLPHPPRPNPPVPNPIPMPPVPAPSPIPEEVLRMDELEQATNFVLQGCHVIPNVDGLYNQLYVGGQFKGNYRLRSQDLELKRMIRSHQLQGRCLMKDAQVLKVQFRPQLLNQAKTHLLARNCHVIPQVSGWADQLIVNGQFKGNYRANDPSEQMKLRAALADRLVSGVCQRRTQQERQLMRDPNLIQDFAHHRYSGCHVRMNVDGIYHQVYVRNQFKGNYHRLTEEDKLRATLVGYLMNGSCGNIPR